MVSLHCACDENAPSGRPFCKTPSRMRHTRKVFHPSASVCVSSSSTHPWRPCHTLYTCMVACRDVCERGPTGSAVWQSACHRRHTGDALHYCRSPHVLPDLISVEMSSRKWCTRTACLPWACALCTYVSTGSTGVWRSLHSHRTRMACHPSVSVRISPNAPAP